MLVLSIGQVVLMTFYFQLLIHPANAKIYYTIQYAVYSLCILAISSTSGLRLACAASC